MTTRPLDRIRPSLRRFDRTVTLADARRPRPNFIIDGLIRPVPFGDLGALGIECGILELGTDRFRRWIDAHVPSWRGRFGEPEHKKLIEFFTGATLLDPGPNDRFLDVAGGVDTYVGRLPCRGRFLHDLRLTREVRDRVGAGVSFLESDAGSIPLPDGSVDAISCHHSFEHFQRDSDMQFIDEVGRLLAPGGRCCIVPIFLADRYVEVTNERTFAKRFDPRSLPVVDPTATIAGHWSGGYARIYDLSAFRERVLARIDCGRFEVRLFEVRLGGREVPDLSLRYHRAVTAINRPYRALLIRRVS
jgi:SAM-dependent methyltransferase